MRARLGDRDRDRFERMVEDAFLRIPGRFRRRIQNLAIVVEDEPGIDELRRARCPRHSTLLGLYHGIPLTERTSAYGMVLPDKISIYQGPIERLARNERELRRIVEDTVWHEVGHYFGMNERQIREAELRWRQAARRRASRPSRPRGDPSGEPPTDEADGQ